MNKIVLKAMMVCISAFSVFCVCDAISNKDQETIVVKYEYKNKDMDRDKRNLENKTYEKDEYGIIFKNKTSEKEILNFYIILNKLFTKYSIGGDALKNIKDLIVNPRKEIKLTGSLAVDLDLREKQSLKNSLKEDLTKLKLTEDEFLKFKKEVIRLIQTEIEKVKNLSKEEKKISFGDNEFQQSLNIKRYLKTLSDRILSFKKCEFGDILKLTKDLKFDKNITEYGKLLP